MATVKRRDGSTFEVEAPPGASDAQITALAAQQDPRRAAPPTAAPAPAPKDLVGRAKESLTKEPPLGSKTMFGETDMPGRVVRAAGDMMLPETWGQAARQVATMPIPGSWATAPLKRVGVGSLAGAIGDTASRGYTGVKDFAGRMLAHGGEQAIGEVLPGALNFGLTQRAAVKPLAEQAAKKAARDAAEAMRQENARPEHEANAGRMRQQHAAIEETRRAGYERAKGEDAARTRAAKGEHEQASMAADEATRVARAEHEGNAQRIRQEHDRLAKTREAKHADAEAARTAEHEAAVTKAKETHATQIREYEQTGAQSIADAFKSKVSAFREFASNEQGLLGMVFGKGPAKLSAEYDKVMRDIARLGRGQDVVIPGNDAAAFGLKPTGIVQSVDPRLPNMAKVDAAQLAEAATGAWKKNPGAYKRAAHALDELGIGNPEARAEYKAGMALIDFASRSNMLKGEKFNPEAARGAFTNVKILDQIRRRGQGDIFEGPIADAVRRPRPELALPAEPAAIPPPRPLAKPLVPPFRAPQGPGPFVPPEATAVPPRPLAKPLVPPFRKPAPLTDVPEMPEGVRTRKLPDMGFWQGAAIAEIPLIVASIASGSHSPAAHGYGLPVAVGGLASSALSGRRVAMEAPVSPLGKFATKVLPNVLTQETAEGMERKGWPAPAR